MRDPASEASRWMDQAKNDIEFARHALGGEFFHQVCFISQQAAEKALKAILYAGGARTVLGRSLVGLVARLRKSHPALEALRDVAAEIDLFYIPARYPNGLVEGVPHRVFTRSQAKRALAGAEAVLAAALTCVDDHAPS